MLSRYSTEQSDPTLLPIIKPLLPYSINCFEARQFDFTRRMELSNVVTQIPVSMCTSLTKLLKGAKGIHESTLTPARWRTP